MKNKLLVILLSVFFFQPLYGENLNIQSSEISIDKNTVHGSDSIENAKKEIEFFFKN